MSSFTTEDTEDTEKTNILLFLVSVSSVVNPSFETLP